MRSEPMVSVVIAAYNMGQYLPQAVNSVLNQSWGNLEVILIDDGSKDDTEHKMSAYSEDYRVRYIRTENRGQPKAKNLGVKSARGDFIAFCDADDYWDEDKLLLQMPEFEDDKVGIVYSEVNYVDEVGQPVEKPQPYNRYSGNVTNELLIKNFVPFGTAVVRRQCFVSNGFFDENLPMGIDWDLWLRFSLAWKFKYIPDKTYFYRVWHGQMSTNYRSRYDNAFKILKKFLEENRGVVSDKLIARAWSDMYSSKAISLAKSERIFFEPLVNIIYSIKYDCFYLPAWKSFLKLLFRRP